jgi:hypothetical protein
LPKAISTFFCAFTYPEYSGPENSLLTELVVDDNQCSLALAGIFRHQLDDSGQDRGFTDSPEHHTTPISWGEGKVFWYTVKNQKSMSPPSGSNDRKWLIWSTPRIRVDAPMFYVLGL